MNIRILRFAQMAAVDRGNGVRTTPLVTESLGSENLTTGITTLQPGAEITSHSHNCDESICVLEGSITFEVDGQEAALGPFDCTFVPEGIPHRFVNQTDQPAVIFLVYASVDVTRTIAKTGQVIEGITPGDLLGHGEQPTG
jgi:putative monooxygenase